MKIVMKPVINGFIKHLILGFYVAMVLGCPNAFAALEKSSKKECAMCHVMWLDVFRTNKETLIPWQPGNVLMKDTQGIVSSEDICYSCHDGYVLDSRAVTWKNHNHTTFKKPSNKVKIPKMLTLSNKDQIYCGTCHTPHSGQKQRTGDHIIEQLPGPKSFLRIPNIDSSLCEACHVAQADYHRTDSHPVHTDKLKIPQALFDAGSVPAQKKNTVTCQTCHQVHGAKGKNLMVMDAKPSKLCEQCHVQKSIEKTGHDLTEKRPDTRNIRGESVSETGACGACHVPHNGVGYKLFARKMAPGNPASQTCLTCHEKHPAKPDSDPKTTPIKAIGVYSHPNNVDSVLKGQPKEPRTPMTEHLPLYTQNADKNPLGTIQCATCHNAHQWDPNAFTKKPVPGKDGDASNRFLRIASSQSSALCLECHKDKQPLLDFDHNLADSAPEAKNINGDTAMVSGPCGACHIPHNARDKTLWARANAPGEPDTPIQYCTGCHSQSGVAKAKPVGGNDHPVDVALTTGQMPLPETVAKILPLEKQTGTQKQVVMTCRTCHQPHLFSPDLKLSKTESDKPYKNIEGDARNSFLRIPASPGPDLCNVCHENASLLTGTDHDLRVTAPQAKNQLGQSIGQSGPCGTCHALHNSPHKQLLWAREFGPVGEHQHPMNALCTGCHSKGGVAQNKIPAVATHPQGKLINNIFTHNDRAAGYIKIFDKQFKEVMVGDLSCSSCHSFAVWDHRNKRKGPGKNIEGDANTSFLRTTSDKTVCVDCHGQTAIWRYAYFHSIPKREKLKGKRP